MEQVNQRKGKSHWGIVSHHVIATEPVAEKTDTPINIRVGGMHGAISKLHQPPIESFSVQVASHLFLPTISRLLQSPLFETSSISRSCHPQSFRSTTPKSPLNFHLSASDLPSYSTAKPILSPNPLPNHASCRKTLSPSSHGRAHDF